MKNAPVSFVEYLLTIEKNYMMATIRMTEILNLISLFQHCKIVTVLSKIFGIFNQKMLSNEIFSFLLAFFKNFQELVLTSSGFIKKYNLFVNSLFLDVFSFKNKVHNLRFKKITWIVVRKAEKPDYVSVEIV